MPRTTCSSRVVLPGIPSAPHGVPRIDVTVDVGQLHQVVVSVTDTATGRSSNVVISSDVRNWGLTDSEVADMVVEVNITAARAAARSRFVGYVDGSRAAC